MSATVRPVWTERDLGSAGWEFLHDQARLRKRQPRDQALALVRYALAQALAGRDTELSRARLEALLAGAPALESVA